MVLAALMFAAQISPNSAVSNISQWAALFNIRLPNVIKDKTADVWVFWICLILLVFYIIFIIILFFMHKHQKKRVPILLIQPDMPISDVTNYMVNDSSVELKKPKPAEIAQFGRAKGHLINWPGIGHQDALARIQTALNNGNLESWGRREVIPNIASFESSLRPIPKEYWVSASRHPFFCFHKTDQAQTIASPNRTVERYTNLMLNKKQVKSLWVPGPLWQRILADLRIIKRKDYFGRSINKHYDSIE